MPKKVYLTVVEFLLIYNSNFLMGFGVPGVQGLLECEEGLEVECWVWEGRVIRAWDLGANC